MVWNTNLIELLFLVVAILGFGFLVGIRFERKWPSKSGMMVDKLGPEMPGHIQFGSICCGVFTEIHDGMVWCNECGRSITEVICEFQRIQVKCPNCSWYGNLSDIEPSERDPNKFLCPSCGRNLAEG